MAKKQSKQPARLQEALVLHKYILNLFGCKDLEALSRDLKDPALEGVDDENVSHFYYALKQHQYDIHIPQEKLFEYDQNIVRHTKAINEKRPEKIQWKYYQYLALTEKDANGKKVMVDKDTNEPLVKISPVALNIGETSFVRSIRDYYEAHKDNTLKGKEIFLLRNESRKGIGFFEASGFYPDFILWVNQGQKQRVVFVDPKGIRNLQGLDHPKIQLFKTLKEEVEATLNDQDISLDSYIISNTPYNQEIFRWGERLDFLKNHVLFDTDDEYVKTLFG